MKKSTESVSEIKNEIKVGDLRLIPKGTGIWSNKNQMNLNSIEDQIVEVKYKFAGNDVIYVTPKQLVINDDIQELTNYGTDEWSLSHLETLPYQL